MRRLILCAYARASTHAPKNLLPTTAPCTSKGERKESLSSRARFSAFYSKRLSLDL
jgi:hypothetical protein